MAKRKQPTKREVAEENKSAWTRFFRETKMEMRKVIWPTKMVRYTIAVLVSVVLVSLLIIVVDFIFMQLSKVLIHTVG